MLLSLGCGGSTGDDERSACIAVDRDAPAWFKEESFRAYVLCFGSSGMFEQDDVENWTSITNVARGWLASRVELDSTMGLRSDGGVLGPAPARWPAPGQAHVGYGEYNQRALLGLWADHLERPAR